MSDYTKPTTLLVHEWSVCDAGLARYDTLAVNFRAWAIGVYGAALAAAVASGDRLAVYIPPIVIILIVACWWADGLFRTLQDHYMSRATEIQHELKNALSVGEPEEYIREFMQATDWIGPAFAAVPEELRGKKAILHMAWQPHLRWFYVPLLTIAILAWLAIATDPAEPHINPDNPWLAVAGLVLVGGWLMIRRNRSLVEKLRQADAEKRNSDRKTRLKNAQSATHATASP